MLHGEDPACLRCVPLSAGLRPAAAQGCIRSQVGSAAVPGAIGEDVGIRQSRWAAGGNIADRSNFERLVVVLAPLEVIDRT